MALTKPKVDLPVLRGRDPLLNRVQDLIADRLRRLQDWSAIVSDILDGKSASDHVHVLSDVIGLVAALAGKASSAHTHAQADVSGLTAALTAKQETSEKGAANGYASLNASTRVPTAQLGSGTANATTYLRGDSSWAAIPASGLSHAEVLARVSLRV